MAVTVHTDASLYRVKNDARTTLSADINNSQTTIPVTDTSKFLTTGGFATITSTDDVDNGNVEQIQYTGISGSDLTGVTRAVDGTTAGNADNGDTIESRVVAQHHNALLDALKTTSQDVFDLTDGTEPFTELTLQDVIGSDTYTHKLRVDGAGHLEVEYNQGRSVYVTDNPASLANMSVWLEAEGESIRLAADRLRWYPKDEMGTGSKVGVFWYPDVADDSGAEAFVFNALKDLADATAYVARFQNNNGTDVCVIQKSKTTVPHLVASTGLVSMPAFTSVRGAPANDEVWFENVSGGVTLKTRIGGTTYSVALT